MPSKSQTALLFTPNYYGYSAFLWQSPTGLHVFIDPYRNRHERYWLPRYCPIVHFHLGSITHAHVVIPMYYLFPDLTAQIPPCCRRMVAGHAGHGQAYGHTYLRLSSESLPNSQEVCVFEPAPESFTTPFQKRAAAAFAATYPEGRDDLRVSSRGSMRELVRFSVQVHPLVRTSNHSKARRFGADRCDGLAGCGCIVRSL